jgi:hypothetical protein
MCFSPSPRDVKQLVAMQSAPALVGTPKFMMVGWLLSAVLLLLLYSNSTVPELRYFH